MVVEAKKILDLDHELHPQHAAHPRPSPRKESIEVKLSGIGSQDGPCAADNNELPLAGSVIPTALLKNSWSP